MKKLALGVALGASLISTAAMAGEQRPTYLAFRAPAAATTTAVAPAGPAVVKRNKAEGAIPLVAVIGGGLAVLGLVVAATTGGDDGSPD